jgi:hypothetical protein
MAGLDPRLSGLIFGPFERKPIGVLDGGGSAIEQPVDALAVHEVGSHEDRRAFEGMPTARRAARPLRLRKLPRWFT